MWGKHAEQVYLAAATAWLGSTVLKITSRKCFVEVAVHQCKEIRLHGRTGQWLEISEPGI